ncbi:Alpha/Beta hydrolase protein [Thamnocephalis sphaerospora]|uniref:Alpha/Beta hydrolase protein n=1 Tax=Thamnocephalis sphaerospora TaxID=78915 RepID=A0A4P9XL94_9FUNG|nr:Alpha/Beta hydrolase protein [Thamnocephalis sphaerospora]|eukprot:RKP06617.1 Alpha/Beta hydrolase protein [Thamnocephalis sphaerospora]
MTVESYCLVATRRATLPIRLHYELHGHGPKRVLLIMGLSCSGEYWLPQAKFLSQQGYQVCFFDNRGVGQSDAPKGYYTTKDMALDTIELLEHLGWESDVHVVGVSMGGMIALELASARPQCIASLSLTSTHAGSTLPPLTGALTLPRLMFTSDINKRIEMNCNLLYPKKWLDMPHPNGSGQTNREAVANSMVERIVRSPVQTSAGAIGQLSAVMRHSVGRDRLERIRSAGIPVLVCTGTEDNLVRPSNSQFLAETLDARFEVFEGCGHAISMQEPERYNQMLLDHIRASSGDTASDLS